MFGIGPISGAKRSKEIIKNVIWFEEFENLDCNIYVFKYEHNNNYELCLIDAGNGLNSKNLIEGLKKINLDASRITKIILTHEHLDHLLGIYNLPQLSGSKPEIYAFGKTSDIIKEANEDAIAPRDLGIPASLFQVSIKPLDVINVQEGDTISLGNFSFKVLSTPGHSLGSMSLFENNLKMLFCGDVVFCGGSFGRVDFPGGSAKQLKNSIERLSKMDISTLCPGHGPISKTGSKEIKLSLEIFNEFYPI